MHTKLLPPFAACLRRAILGAIFLAAATHATEPATPPPDPAKQIKLEVRLLEMTPRQADLVEQTLLRWCADPSLQGPELDQILWGNAAKKVAELTGTAVSGQGWAKVENIREKKAVIPHGAPTGYAPAPTALRNLGEYLMFRGRLSTNGSYCDVDPGFQWNRMGEHKVNNFSFGSSFSTLQGLPLLLVRRDLAGSAELLVARVTWAAPVVKTWPSTERNTDKSLAPLYLRAQIFTVPQALLGEVARVKDNSPALVEWLKKRGIGSSLVTVVTSAIDEGFSLVNQDDEVFYLSGGPEALLTIGTQFHGKFTVEHGNVVGTIEEARFYEPKSASGLLGSPAAGRYFSVKDNSTHEHTLNIPVGGAAAIPIGEYKGLPVGSKLDLMAMHWVPTDDAFVVFQPIWPGQIKPTATAGGSTPIPQKAPTPPATPSPAFPPPAGKTPK